MKQRLGLARVLLHDPELLLLDEPASGLDPRARIEVREILKELSGMGKTILISSHILHELSHLCTRIGILEAGTLMTEGSLHEIYSRLGLMQIVHVQIVSGPPDLAAAVGRINGVESVETEDRPALDPHSGRVPSPRGSARPDPQPGGTSPHVPARGDGAGDGVPQAHRGKDRVKPADVWRAVTVRGLPILRKDPLEMAVQRRTYLIRFGYALGLFVLACSLFYANIGLSAGAGQTLGRGADHFANLMTFQLAALRLLVPILTAGALTAEKERETLALLLLTTLTPRQIVLQKFASRMTPILSFVFLSFPLMAITYTFGGVTVEELLIGIVLLVFTCLVLGAVAIMCSAYCRTTFEALIATYLSSLVICGFLVSCLGSTFLNPRADISLAVTAVVSTGLCTFVVASCLSMAESILISRAFVPYRSHLMAFFRWLDAPRRDERAHRRGRVGPGQGCAA